MSDSAIIDSLLIKLNATDLQQKNPKLYQFLKDLSTGMQGVNNTVTVVAAGGGGGGGGVTGSGTAGVIAQWTAATALGDVDAAGISAALDLL